MMQSMRHTPLVLLATVACGAAVPHRPGALVQSRTFATGPGEPSGHASNVGHWSWDDYQREIEAIRRYVVPLARPHPRASARAMYGVNMNSGGKNVGWVVDGDASAGYWLVVDADHDGELEHDRVHPMRRDRDHWYVDVTTEARVPSGPATKFRVIFDGVNVRVDGSLVRSGTIDAVGRPMRFAISCPNADCSATDWVRIGFDLDGNGAVDLESAGSFERYALRDQPLVIADHAYEYGVAADGGALTLRRLATKHAARPQLRAGTPAPDLVVETPTGRFALSARRGHFVLIDFFSIGCRYCIEDAPWLASLHARLADRGLDLVTIATEIDPAELVRAVGSHPWPTAIELGSPGPIAALYRVDAYPAYFLVGPDGKIECARCTRDEVDRAIAERFPRRSVR
jgi:hypothetical protein